MRYCFGGNCFRGQIAAIGLPWQRLMNRIIRRFWVRTNAATSVEYAVLLALILMVVFAAIALVGQRTSASWNNSNTSLQGVNFGS